MRKINGMIESAIQPDPIQSEMWVDLASDPNGGVIKRFNKTNNSWDIVIGGKEDKPLQLNIDDKVDKEYGKGLSTNDYTNADKQKLSTLCNYDDSTLIARIQDLENRISVLEGLIV